MSKEFHTGVIRQERESYAWCDIPEIEKPVRVNLKFLKRALHGDEVLIKVKDDKYGFVQKITKRCENVITGQLQLNKGYGFVKPWNKNYYKDFFVDKKFINGAKNGDVVEFKFKDWKAKDKSPRGVVTKRLKDVSPSEQLMYKLNVKDKFSEEVLEEVSNIELTENDFRDRLDIRYLDIFSIDPKNCTDADDALSIERLNNGYRVGIHIADVSHFVKVGSNIDKEAYNRSFTTYFPNYSIPMIPRELSSNLCSLLEKQDRLAVSLFIDIDKDWNIIDTDVKRTVINNRKAFTYEEAQEHKDDTNSPYYNKLNNLYNIGKKVRNDHFLNEIELELPDMQWEIDNNENPVKLKIKKRIETMELIQSWMLMANKIVTQMVEKKDSDIQWVYRVHPEIPEENIETLKTELKQFGEEWIDNMSISDNVRRLLKTDDSIIISELLIKKFKPAKYSTNKIGHFSLGADDYAHFTSPIRRYSDIIIHRILLQKMKNKNVYSVDLERDCTHISLREKAVDKVSREYNQIMCMKFVKDIDYALTGKVIYSTTKGLLIKTELMIDGWIPSKILSEYDMKYNEDTRRWDNVYGEEYFIGQTVRVKIDRLNYDKNEILLKFNK